MKAILYCKVYYAVQYSHTKGWCIVSDRMAGYMATGHSFLKPQNHNKYFHAVKNVTPCWHFAHNLLCTTYFEV